MGITRWYGGYVQEDRNKALEILQELEIGHLSEQPIRALSGGQLQRVMIARALASEPKILFLDEPTTSLDPHSEKTTISLLNKINRRATIIIVSHDIGFISHHIKRVACLNRTLVCHPAEALTPDILKGLYESPVHLIHHHHHIDEGHS